MNLSKNVIEQIGFAQIRVVSPVARPNDVFPRLTSNSCFTLVNIQGVFTKVTMLGTSRSTSLWYVADAYYKADSRFAPKQWETALHCNDVSHWLGARLESALYCVPVALLCSVSRHVGQTSQSTMNMCMNHAYVYGLQPNYIGDRHCFHIINTSYQGTCTAVTPQSAFSCPHLGQWPMTYLMTLSDWTMSCQPWPPRARYGQWARYK